MINTSALTFQEDDDNSMEPPLVIDETEDFESGERSGAKTSVTELLCQGCKKNKAFFMCAGCSRQWYCSKECQVWRISHVVLKQGSNEFLFSGDRLG